MCLLLHHMRSRDTGRDACSKGEQVCCVLLKDFEKGYRNNTMKDSQENDFYKCYMKLIVVL